MKHIIRQMLSFTSVGTWPLVSPYLFRIGTLMPELSLRIRAMGIVFNHIILVGETEHGINIAGGRWKWYQRNWGESIWCNVVYALSNFTGIKHERSLLYKGWYKWEGIRSICAGGLIHEILCTTYFLHASPMVPRRLFRICDLESRTSNEHEWVTGCKRCCETPTGN